MRWGQHNSIERGNAVHVFEGNNFSQKKSSLFSQGGFLLTDGRSV
jgi:hypothetical protein